MVIETALGRIIAGALVFMDAVYSCFVSANFAGSGLDCNAYDCGLSSYTGSLTSCGRYIADLEAITRAFPDLLQQILPALGIA
jgi:hypothetical protein